MKKIRKSELQMVHYDNRTGKRSKWRLLRVERDCTVTFLGKLSNKVAEALAEANVLPALRGRTFGPEE